MIRALISIGTNSTRALVARFGGGTAQTLLARSTGTRIGEGLRERGHLEEAAMQRTLDAIADHAAAIREHTPAFRVIATSALRRADNEAVFNDRVRALTGASIEIISGDEEAACSFAGAVSGIEVEPGERFGVLDVGGGSSEYAVGSTAGPERVLSCEIGAVRLTEAFPALAGTGGEVDGRTLAQAAAYAGAALAPAAALPRGERIVLVGGSATTAVSLVRGGREPFAYAQLSAAQVRDWVDRLGRTPLGERKTLAGMNPQRADILLGGLLIIGRFLEAARCATALVSTNDVLLGYLLRHPG